ncbi:MAG: hypothetical protein LBR88_07555 [Zoogloeaceae bacterium]|nr:hypothetical protein [Zoogloeaceae bacterium]
MSLPKPDLHLRIEQEQDDQLSVLSTLTGRSKADIAAEILERGIVGEFHTVTIAAKRMAHLGLTGIDGEREGR